MSAKKVLKPEKHANPKILVWNGTVKVLRGTLATDIAEKIGVPSNIAQLVKFGKSCLKTDKHYPTITSSYQVSEGPKSDGLMQNDFEPCAERKRADKMIRPRRLGSFGSKRIKRSESYTYSSMLWKDPSLIRYAFDSSVPESIKPSIEKAIQFWRMTTCLTFTEFNETESRNQSHILFTSKVGSCSTDRLGPNPTAPYATTIDLSICGNLSGSVAHEIGHAVGLTHSQKRVDRDDSVKVFLSNVAASWQSQFELDPAQYFDEWGVPYYYDSIMHYFPYAASKNGLMTVCPLDPLMEVIMGQREEPAFGDISLVNRMYCQESCFNRDILKGMQFSGNFSRTISGRVCQNWSTQTPHTHKFTTVGNHRSCRNPDGWDGGPWCYTTDPNVRYEPCFSPCETMRKANRPACNGWCYNGGYFNPKRCKCICPRYTTGEFCENVDTGLLHTHIPCGGKTELKKVGDKAAISSPNWPTNYTENSVCMWWIQAPTKAYIKLTILDFFLEIPDETGCYDYLEIRPSVCAAAFEKPDKMRFCGNSLAPINGTLKELYSDDNNMVLKLFTDVGENARGFSLIVEAVATAQ